MDVPIMEELVKLLETSPDGVKFVFIKKDGSERYMHGTLYRDNLPDTTYDDPAEITKAKNDMFNCWDMELGAWRTVNLKKGYRLV